MELTMTALIVFIVIVLLVVVYAISIYNKLVTLRNRFKKQLRSNRSSTETSIRPNSEFSKHR